MRFLYKQDIELMIFPRYECRPHSGRTKLFVNIYNSTYHVIYK